MALFGRHDVHLELWEVQAMCTRLRLWNTLAYRTIGGDPKRSIVYKDGISSTICSVLIGSTSVVGRSGVV